MKLKDVDKLSEKDAKELLKQIIKHLDELDYDDTFGTEGWRHSFGLED